MFAHAAFLSLALFLAPFVVAETHDITVGGADGQLEFSPEAIAAQPGDNVVFHFQQKNHTATQSSFANPCGLKDGGFDTGFMPVAANVTDSFPTYTITVNDTTPIWVFCRQAANTAASHCGQGMVFAVNCGADGSPNSFTNFKNSALAIGASLSAAASSSSAAAAPYGAAPSATDPATTPQASAPPADTASAASATHTVTVGASGQLAFSPSQLSAQVNDVVVFQFQAKNHTVTQSSFPAPCRKLASTSTTGQIGFDSGFMPVAANTTDFPTWSITVNDTNPIWAYCRQSTPVSHCGSGMVLAINSVENSTKSFSAFQALAMQLNGTSSTNTTTSGASGASTTGSTTSDASRLGVGIGLALGAVGAAFSVLA